MYKICISESSQAEKVQLIFNHPKISCALGGFTFLEGIKDKIKGNTISCWHCEDTSGNILGAMMAAGRPQSHILKFGSVGTVPEYRRQGIGTALYCSTIFQSILEGRRLFEDTIVGDNEEQRKFLLPSLGIQLSGELLHKTATGKTLCIYQLSLLNEGSFEKVWERFNKFGHFIELVENEYTADLWDKNMLIIQRHMPQLEAKLSQYREIIRESKLVTIKYKPIKIQNKKSEKKVEQNTLFEEGAV